MSKKVKMMNIENKIFYTTTEVSKLYNEPQYVLRYWETHFPMLRPMQLANRRYYRQSDMQLLERIKQLLREDLYTIKGARKIIDEEFKKD